MPRYR